MRGGGPAAPHWSLYHTDDPASTPTRLEKKLETKPLESPTKWRQEYDNQTDLWKDQCKARWARAEALVEAGYKIILLPPLEKRALPRNANMGIHSPITSAKTLRTYTYPGGDYFDSNYGIVTGLGTCTVLDFDQTEERPGIESLIDLESKYSFYVPRQCIVNTPSGGMHLYLAYDESLSPRVRPFGQSIGMDILNSNGDKANRHAVGPESVTEKGIYKEHKQFPILSVSLLAEYEIPTGFKKLLPEQAHNVVGMDGKPAYVNGNRGSEQVGQDDVFTKLPLSELMDVLDHIDVKSTSFDEWLRVGMAIHSERGDDGFELWNEWSAEDPDRYDIKALQSHWQTFREVTGGVTIGTAINMARENGYRMKPAHAALSMMDNIQSETPNAYLGGQCKFIRVTDDGEVQEMAMDDVKSWYADREVVINGKPVNPITLFMRWSGRIKYDRYELLPPPAVCPPTTVNVWKGFRLKPKEGDIGKYMELFNLMFGEDVKEWVHDWFADLIQNTGIKPDTALVLQGPEGTGKNTLIDVFRSMFKDNNTTHFVSTDQFTSKFNKHIARSVLAVVNEAVWSGNHKHASMLKGYVSESKFEVQDKNVKSFQARNCTRIVVMSNDDWAIPADRDARRFCVCRIDKFRDSSDPWWKNTRRILAKPEVVAAVMHWYKQRVITNNLHEVPQTKELQKQKAFTKARMRVNDKPFVDVTLHLLREGKAIKRIHEGGSVWYYMSSNMIKNAYHRTQEKICSDQWIWAYKQWIDANLGIQVNTGIKTKHKGVQRQASSWPEISTVAKALAKFEMVDVADIDCQDAWNEDDIPW